ncbi:hypothetical protein JOQ06_013150 [Pogonophryne albipinna]|uniref:TGF-beta family profile domain-containing protein n=1 Tax=Pogonophryne albipinna TaxID=1090488 RepID=A0AAD6BGM5_9TELE|nr:hypothetical protein JOQ06_013150 [Pogonophryne albipinna]
MRVLLKLILVLCYVQRGEGHSLPSLIGESWITNKKQHLLHTTGMNLLKLLHSEPLDSEHLDSEPLDSEPLDSEHLNLEHLDSEHLNLELLDSEHLKLGASGLGASELGASGLGASELGASGLGASELGASELGASGLLASGPSPAPLVPARSRRSALASPCGLRSVLLQVQHLGLGYDSDETVLFKYCSGTCPHARNNHDLTLSNLLQSGVLPGDVREHHHAPCCRPTLHEDIAFLDNSHRWHKVEKLSAAGCSCVG